MRSLARPFLPAAVRALTLGVVLTGTAGAASAATAAAPLAGPRGPAPGTALLKAIAAKPFPGDGTQGSVPPLGRLRQADVLVVAGRTLPAGLAAGLRRLPGVVASVPVDAGRIKVNGVFVNVLGVDPAAFRPFAPGPTARSAVLWQNVAAGGMAVSYTMGKLSHLSLDKPLTVTGARTLRLRVAGFGTVGVGGVDAVVSDAVARKLGLPRSNAIVISAPKARLDVLIGKIKKAVPADAAVAALVTQVIANGTPVVTSAAGALGVTSGQGLGLSGAQIVRFLTAAESRVGMPYVWGANGPTSFDCSGLVQWSMAQAGVLMPRVAAAQARTGPLVPLAQLQPGDLLFYHTDPTAPSYISHVAIYIGGGLMLQAPEPGMNVQIVRADFGAGFAGAVRVYPRIAGAVAANPAG